MRTPAVRRADETDADAVARLLAQLGYTASPGDVRARLRHIAESPADHVLVASTDTAVVGLVGVNIAPLLAEGGMFARITALVVGRAQRGTGLGRLLMSEAERLARTAGCSRIQVSSGRRPEREAAHRFYPRLGYVDTSDHHVLYEKRL